jgi:hypothetical protein
LRQVEKTLPVFRNECGDIDKCCHAIATLRGGLRGDDASHAVADNNGWLGIAREHGTQTFRAGLQRDLVRGCMVLTETWQVERLRRVSCGIQAFHQRSPNPRAGERTVDEHKSRHKNLLSGANNSGDVDRITPPG